MAVEGAHPMTPQTTQYQSLSNKNLLAKEEQIVYVCCQHTCHASSQCVTLAGFFISKNHLCFTREAS